ncbi:MAG TPA: succinate dehydrogenase, cytochrome b556 subunit [Steroidobacteraceae bacterium]|nr:succinate dehydrogenase, cytochrome b556 subunit [Steroidobacteraceae bacterium]
MAKRDKPLVRPLSPFWQYTNLQTLHTMGFSILHRITGVALTIGSILLVYWLTAAAIGPAAYAQAEALFGNVIVKIALIGFVFSFCYHFLNGIRHLVWDTGRGFDLKVSRNSGYAVFVGALILTAVVAVFVVRVGSAV